MFVFSQIEHAAGQVMRLNSIWRRVRRFIVPASRRPCRAEASQTKFEVEVRGETFAEHNLSGPVVFLITTSKGSSQNAGFVARANVSHRYGPCKGNPSMRNADRVLMIFTCLATSLCSYGLPLPLCRLMTLCIAPNGSLVLVRPSTP